MIKAIMEQWGPGLKLDNGKLVFTTGNIGKLQELSNLLNKVAGLEGEKLMKWFVDQTNKNADLNLKYFNTVVPDKKPLAQKAYKSAIERILSAFGYDGKNFIKNGFLFDLTMTGDPIRKIKAEAIKAISSGQSYKDFAGNINNYIGGNKAANRAGVIESHFRTNAYDTFQQVDRQIGNQMSDSLGLNYAMYAGGIMDTTREFCIKKVGKVFSRKEIQSWENESWEGKPKSGYNPFTDLGGYNCTHTLDWISDGMAERLLKMQDDTPIIKKEDPVIKKEEPKVKKDIPVIKKEDPVKQKESFTPVKTIDEAEKYIVQKNIAEKPSFKGADIDGVNIIIKKVTDLFDQYNIKPLGVIDNKNRKANANAAANGQIITFTNKYIKSGQKQIEDNFKEFLETNDIMTLEYLIPVEVSRYLSKNLVKVKVLVTTSKWYGITYKEDKELLVSEINKLIEKNEYPKNLW